MTDDPWAGSARAYADYAAAHPLYADTSRDLVALAGLEPDAMVLDLACGTGATTREILAALGPAGRVTGVDGSAGMLARAAQSTSDSRVRFLLGTAERVDAVAPGPFDAAVCNSAMWQTVLPETFAAVRRVLGEGGRLAFNVPAPYLGEQPDGTDILARAVELARAEGWQPPSGRPRRWPPAEEIAALLTAAGYQRVRVERRTYQVTVAAEHGWLSIPIFTERALAGLPYEQRRRLVDAAYAQADPAAVTQSSWAVFVAYCTRSGLG